MRWPAVRGVMSEGLLLVPEGEPIADVVAIPDADQTPEQIAGLAEGVAPESQFARRLAESGCRVLVPALVNRGDALSSLGTRRTNQPHREFLYRPAFEMGHHIIGYEVQKVLAGVDWFAHESGGKRPIGVAGYGEGGLLAIYSAALDPRVDATLVSGYFDSRQNVWQEPIYRNVFGLLDEFGDAELASLVAPGRWWSKLAGCLRLMARRRARRATRVGSPGPAGDARRGDGAGRTQPRREAHRGLVDIRRTGSSWPAAMATVCRAAPPRSKISWSL